MFRLHNHDNNWMIGIPRSFGPRSDLNQLYGIWSDWHLTQVSTISWQTWFQVTLTPVAKEPRVTCVTSNFVHFSNLSSAKCHTAFHSSDISVARLLTNMPFNYDDTFFKVTIVTSDTWLLWRTSLAGYVTWFREQVSQANLSLWLIAVVTNDILLKRHTTAVSYASTSNF